MSDIEVTRLLPAPPDEVFRWWTEAELLERWMSPLGSVEADIDLRVGGSFRIVMRHSGFEIDHTGEYLEIDRPRRLVLSWHSRYTAGPSQVTISFQAEGQHGTRLLIVHSGLPDDAANDHRGGWATMVGRLLTEMQAA
jgi:uncharacterized protein YndB with AHSA1/START domain